MPSWIDGTLYPDTDVPDAVETLDDRVDFLARLCAAWDFGVLPEHETLVEITPRRAVNEPPAVAAAESETAPPEPWRGAPRDAPRFLTFGMELR